jgi:DNA-directed RNA polymerase sigma subunit (sigma70/sigma32)
MTAVPCLPTAVFGRPVEHVPADQEDTADVAISRAMRSRLYRCIGQLDPDLRRVVLFRYGIAGFPQQTLRELAHHMGISPAGVLKLERRALDCLREWL